MLHKNKKAFSLVELSIVLIVIGLLVSTVTVSMKLIQNSKVRVVLQEIENLKAAINTFRASYDAYPGDFEMATDFFASVSNGDGDKIIEYDSIAESAYAWKHLQLAQMLGGDYSGSYIDAGRGSTANSNAPKTKYADYGCYNFTGDATTANTSEFTSIPFGENNFTIGARWYNNPCIGSLFIPNDAYSIDQKMDDGKPATGNIRGGGGQINPASSSPAGSANASSSCVASSKYKVIEETPECVLAVIF